MGTGDEVARAFLDERTVSVAIRTVADLDPVPHPFEQVTFEPLVITWSDVEDHPDLRCVHGARFALDEPLR
jgi:hypothetical protein